MKILMSAFVFALTLYSNFLAAEPRKPASKPLVEITCRETAQPEFCMDYGIESLRSYGFGDMVIKQMDRAFIRGLVGPVDMTFRIEEESLGIIFYYAGNKEVRGSWALGKDLWAQKIAKLAKALNHKDLQKP